MAIVTVERFTSFVDTPMRTALALTLAVTFPALARAAPDAVPAVVAARILKDGKACAPQPATIKHGFLTQRNVTGGTKPDYILDYQYFLCGSMQGFCGSGGCWTVVFAPRGNGYVKIIDDLVDKIEFKEINGRPAALFVRGGSSCGNQDNAHSCFETRIWDGASFKPAR